MPKKLHDAGKAPSWKAIATAILKNDLNLYSLGFSKRNSAVLNQIVEDARIEKESEDMNLDLFGGQR